MEQLSSPGTRATEHAKVLVVDDDPLLRHLTKSMLSTLTLDVVEAEDGRDAWEKLRTGNFRLALVDLEMPNFDGFSLIQCARAYPRTRHMPIVVVTSRDDVSALRQALEAGASSYLIKPVQWSMFGAHIKHLLRLSQVAISTEMALAKASEVIEGKDALLSGLQTELQSRLEHILELAVSKLACDQSVKQPAELVSALESVADAAVAAQEALSRLVGGSRLIDLEPSHEKNLRNVSSNVA
jgi:DNA-binding response OmpR family regulator